MAKKNNADKAREKRTRYGYGERFYTNRLLLERLNENDVDFFMQIAGDNRVRLYFKEYRNRRKNGLKKYYLEEVVDKQGAYNLALVIRLKDETPIGFINLYYVQAGEWLCEYAVLESFRRKGYVTEVLDNLCDRNVEFLLTFGIHSAMTNLIFEVTNDNYASSKLIKKFMMMHCLRGETSMKSYFACFESLPGETWYRVRLN